MNYINKVLEFIKTNDKKLLVGLLIAALLIVSYKQYVEKKMYEAHMSHDLNRDIHNIIYILAENHHIYEEILESNKITRYQAYMLTSNHNNLIEFPQNYGALAVKFNRLDKRENNVAPNAQIIHFFFGEMGGFDGFERQTMHQVILELDERNIEKLQYLQSLNYQWLEAAQRNVRGFRDIKNKDSFEAGAIEAYYGKHSLSKRFWIDFIVDLEKTTKDYMSEKNFFTIETILGK